VVEEVSESQQRGGQTSQNRTFRSVPRPLLTADEVRRLKGPARDAAGLITKPGELLIFPAHQHVIRGTQSLAFLDPAFQYRMTFPAPATMWTRQS
jgi:type IV secretion system protein VirD4